MNKGKGISTLRSSLFSDSVAETGQDEDFQFTFTPNRPNRHYAFDSVGSQKRARTQNSMRDPPIKTSQDTEPDLMEYPKVEEIEDEPRSWPTLATKRPPNEPVHRRSNDALLEENNRLRDLVKELEKRADGAEQALQELSQLKYTQTDQLFERYKEATDKRYQELEDIAQGLKQSNELYEQDNQALRAILEENRKEIVMLRSNRHAITSHITTKIENAQSQTIPMETASITKQATVINDDREQLRNKIKELSSSVQWLEKEKDTALSANKDLMAKLAQASTKGIADEDQKNLRRIKFIYEELTGLLITDIKTTETGNLYNCIQMGRNGTIHFKLFHPSAPNEDMHYQPVLDRRRDAGLLSYLPEYLTSEIDFSKEKASLFLWRLNSFLQSSEKDKKVNK
ncbi:chromosome segregation protein Csm1/Pcs1-domain-containing protein [Radiomyces spectabilis]|uniref:chromosome segregation protein Csm1/Pcs1-domain-containing protein n=1 Tax=Radiomyces spectabilis TaxID=64574 RepID=UPI00221E8224|nr:chromosome segregation protein Csm1/Pcs1-domain-containing protein [Radiomyces spectabilis]KAI8379532.1 chromosome segregation protein Csm1/Pcs1-domain-containing protein [Radiomyces spectabilis]